MKKRFSKLFISGILIIVLTFALIGCDGNSNSGSEDNGNSSTKNPSAETVIENLKKVPGIIDIEAASESHDPNGKLNKSGGYTAAVYFSHEKVDQSEFDEESVIDKGTDCGGQIEVYKNAKNAKERNEELSAFDGTFLDSGYHEVFGTMVIRVSCNLTASQQSEIANAIKAAFN